MDKRITLDIEGKKVTCFFSGNHFYTFLAEGLDASTLVDALKGKLSAVRLLEILPTIFYAGYKAQCKIKSESPSVKYESFEHHILKQDISSAPNFLNKFINLFNS